MRDGRKKSFLMLDSAINRFKNRRISSIFKEIGNYVKLKHNLQSNISCGVIKIDTIISDCKIKF